MNFQAIYINSYQQESVIAANKYSKFQLWICRIFKLTPEFKFYYTVKATVSNVAQLRKGDIFKAIDGTDWRVIKINKIDSEITVMSIKPYLNYYIVGLAIFIAMSFHEN